MIDRELINLACEAAKNSYSPYSKIRIGAAIECENKTVYTGCTIENASLGCSLCAETVALAKAVSEGCRSFTRIAIYAESPKYCFPSGESCQTLSEFSPDIEVLCSRRDGRYVSYKLSELLPHPFAGENIV